MTNYQQLIWNKKEVNVTSSNSNYILHHLISGKGIYSLSHKVQIIKNHPPKTPKEGKQMLGLACYCQKFIPAYADLIWPLTELTCKFIPFIWMDQCQKAFETLKNALMKSHNGFSGYKQTICIIYWCFKICFVYCMLQEHVTIIDGKTLKHKNHNTYVSGLFEDCHSYWAALTRKACMI